MDGHKQAGATPGIVGEHDARIDAELVQTLYQATPVPVAAGVPFVLVVTAVLWHLVPQAVLLAWLALKLLIALVRYGETARYLADPARARRSRYWVRRYQLLMCIDTFSWAAMVPLFAPYAQGLTLALLMCGVVGVTALGVFTTFSHLASSLLYSATVMAPMGIYFALQGTAEGGATAAASAIYLAVVGYEAWRSHGRQVEMLRLRFENAAIAEERQQALAVAEASSQAKSRFLATVSHEMRTPLNGILGMAELLREEARAPQERQRIDIVARSARHMNRIIGDLLDLSRIEFGRLTIESKPMHVLETVGEVTGLLAAVAGERGLKLHTRQLGPVPRHVLGDASRIKQVLHNLIGNAIKFTREGQIELVICAATPGRLQFEVIDSGPGIAPDQAGRLFEAFERGTHQGADHNSAGGTGLGLTISRRLAVAMGGDVEYQPEPGGGSRFIFTLAAPAAEPPPAPAPMATASLSPDTRLLVVDDNEVNALVARAMLERLGAQVDVAGDGFEALEAMARQHYAAVLMDCQMPRLDGLSATRRWRAAESGARLPIIGVTANATEDDRRDCLASGMDAHLAKPFTMDELSATLAAHLRQERAGAGV